MTKSQHTPTPWETSSNADHQWDVCAEGAGDMIADLAHCDNGEANASFIVRACNAHDALIEALSELEQSVEAYLNAPADARTDELEQAVRNARAALHQAREG